MTCPRFRFTMPGRTMCVTATKPFMLVSIIRSQSRRSHSCAGLSPRPRPALLTYTVVCL